MADMLATIGFAYTDQGLVKAAADLVRVAEAANATAAAADASAQKLAGGGRVTQKAVKETTNALQAAAQAMQAYEIAARNYIATQNLIAAEIRAANIAARQAAQAQAEYWLSLKRSADAMGKMQGQAMAEDLRRQAKATRDAEQAQAAYWMTLRKTADAMGKLEGQAMAEDLRRQAKAAREAEQAQIGYWQTLRKTADAMGRLQGQAMAEDLRRQAKAVREAEQAQIAYWMQLRKTADALGRMQGQAMAEDKRREAKAVREAEQAQIAYWQALRKTNKEAAKTEQTKQMQLGTAMSRDLEAYNRAHGQALEMEKRRVASLGTVNGAMKQVRQTGLTLTDVLTRLGLTFTTLQVVGAVKDVLMLAARYETLGIVVDTVGRNLGKTTAEMNGYVDALQKGNITMIGSREELARMASANLDIAQAANIARVAQNAAVIAGINSSEAFERIITGITTQQPRVLRTLGIYVNFEAAQERYAKSVGKRMEQLTAAERTQVNMNTAMKGGAQVAGVYEAAMDTAGKQVTSFVRYVQDLKTRIGEVFQPAFTAAVFAAASAFEFMGRHAKAIAAVLSVGVVVGGVAAAGALWGLVAASTALTASAAAMWVAISGPIAPIILILGALGAAGYKAFGFMDRAAERKKQMQDMADGVAGYRKEIQKLTEAQLKAELTAAQYARTVARANVIIAEQQLNAYKQAAASPNTAHKNEDHGTSRAGLLQSEKALTEARKEFLRTTLMTAAVEQTYNQRLDENASKNDEKIRGVREYEKALRDSAEKLALSKMLADAGASATLAEKRAIEDRTDAIKLEADEREIRERFADKDTTQLIANLKATYANNEALKASTRALEDQNIEMAIGEARWARNAEEREKAAKILDEERLRVLAATEARDDGVRAINEELKVQQQGIAIAQARGAVQKRELAYLDLYAAKYKEYLDKTRVGAVADPQTADALAKQFVAQERLLDALNAKSAAWGDTLRNVSSIAQDIARSFGSVGKQLASVISAAMQFVELLKKQKVAQDAVNAANKALAANPNDPNLQGAANASKSASSAANLNVWIAAAMAIVAFADAIDLFGKKARERTKRLQEEADAFNRALQDFSLAFTSSIEKELRDNIRAANDLIKAAKIHAPEVKSVEDIQALRDMFKSTMDNLGAGWAKGLAPALDTLEKILALARDNERIIRERNTKEVTSQTEDLSVRRLRAQGQEDLADIRELEITQAKALKDAIDELTGADGFEAFIQSLQEVQLAELNAALAAKALAEARRIFDLNNQTQAFSDPRGARQNAFDEAQARRYADAQAKGASAAELAAIALFNLAEAADYAAQLAESDRRSTESLIARIFGASGDSRAAEDATFVARQRQEIADAIRDGMSPSNLALLRFALFAEASQLQMQRNIEDQTRAIREAAKHETAAIDLMIEVTRSVADAQIKAIDAQIETIQKTAKADQKRFEAEIKLIQEATKAQTDAIDAQIEGTRAALDVAQKQVSALEQQVQTNRQIVDSFKEFKDALALGDQSILSPQSKLDEARRQFDAIAAAAAGGDSAAAMKLPGAAQALLDASRAFNASNMGYVADYNRVNAVMDAIAQQFGATLPIDEQTLEAAKKQVESLQQTIDALGEQKDAITTAAQLQIDALEAAKAKAAEDAQAALDKLEETKKAIEDKAQLTIDKLQEQKDAIEKAADDQIAVMEAYERQAHADRIRDHAFYTQFLDILSNGQRAVLGDGTTIINSSLTSGGSTVAQDSLTAQNAMVTEIKALRTEVAALKAEVTVLSNVAVAASQEQVEAIHGVESAVDELTGETRLMGQALAVTR